MKFLTDKDIAFEIPMSRDEISFSDYVDFKEAMRFREDGMSRANMIEAVSVIVPNAHLLPYGTEPKADEPAKLISVGDDLTVCALFVHIMSIIETPVEPRLAWKYKDEWFEIGGASALLSQSGDLTTGEVITTELVIERYGKLIEESRKNGVASTQIAVYDFEMDLRVMAALLRKNGETLPYQKAAREKFLDERTLHFQGCSLAMAVEVGFFLRSMFDAWWMSQFIEHFGTDGQ